MDEPIPLNTLTPIGQIRSILWIGERYYMIQAYNGNDVSLLPESAVIDLINGTSQRGA